MRRAAGTLALAALASACSLGSPPAPTLESVTPDRTRVGTATDVTVRGTGFTPRIRADLDGAGGSSAAPPALALVHDAIRVPLEAIGVVSDAELTARVPPLPTPAAYDLELVDARGRSAVLPAAFTVEPVPGCGPDGTPCDDGNVCTQGDTCQGDVCVAGRSVCPNTAPRACLVVTPEAPAPGEHVTLDASCSSDAEDPATALLARFDPDGDDRWTSLGHLDRPETFAFPSAGLWTATVEVVDSGGLSDFASRLVLVTDASDRVLVTTTADEADPNATPAAPGNAGLSLREAIAYVNRSGTPATIGFDFAVSGPIVHASALPALTQPGAAIVGRPDVALEFPGVTSACVALDGPSELLLGATVTGCGAAAVQVSTNGAGAQIAECTVSPASSAHGIVAKASATIGPRNVVTGADKGLKLSGPTCVVVENLVSGNQTGVSVVSDVDLRLVRNRIVSNWGPGLETTPSASPCTLVHNVFDANGGDGVALPPVSVSGVGGAFVARNNLFTRNGGCGVQLGSGLATLDHNGFFANAKGPLSSGSPGDTDLLEDPLYGGEHRLAPGSPAVDRGVDALDLIGVDILDLLGPAERQWTGASPDLGAWESPYTR